ncbi:undecaprenyl-diphosphate phosphatase [Escherichia coli]|uniref:undecaprenyl-diphosphate phosphatase n=1 Tax=Escherichia coli TaxID=562 RepID=UPI000BB4125D|nr:undecaprenyl-diphosphate phosphatase [Escherichia coli]EEW7626653.1 undecaprenyl-diphosphate phosphatase [Escherichia coli]EFE7620182.1 undecaprenyl-diphosphate phosphatase [Escherichia coli]EGJ6243718.1 undecaprenyl-diphosphate phosphatase [Escherichia coli]EGO8051259.1 undecaprenyl-diphosphate phosphatase [Escherichia coli]EGO8890322.1 undecaprenyl-diphosphate phosphatase [Escherichia coli]
MLENLNLSLFSLINATPDSAPWMISLAIFIAKDLITVVPLLAAVLWLWGLTAQRQLVIKIAIALAVSLFVSWTMGHLFPHDRPFVENIGYNFLHHAADDSFPSDHGTVIFTFALAFLCWHRLWSGSLLMVLAVVIAWSRVYLGVHWPLDMLGGLLAGMIGCLSAQIIWQAMGHKLYQRLQSWYRFCFALTIRKGWVRD